MAADGVVKTTTAIIWGILLWLAVAVFEALLQVFVFKKFGVCPECRAKKHK